MDPRNGAILALGSYPSFDANVFAKPISQKRYDDADLGGATARRCSTARSPRRIRPARRSSRSPRWRRSRTGVITPEHDDRSTTASSSSATQKYQNAKDAVYGPLQHVATRSRSPRTCSSTSSARRPTRKGPVHPASGRSKLGFGRKTGIDIPGEFAGPGARRDVARHGLRRVPRRARRRRTSPPGTTPALYECGGIERPWTTGDNVNLAVGQGDLQATPLQLAGRLLGARQRRHGRHARTSARRSRTATGGSSRRSARRSGAARSRSIRPTAGDHARRPARRRHEPRRHVGRRLHGLARTATRSTARPAPPSAQPNPDQSWYACYVDGPDAGRSWSS